MKDSYSFILDPIPFSKTTTQMVDEDQMVEQIGDLKDQMDEQIKELKELMERHMQGNWKNSLLSKLSILFNFRPSYNHYPDGW